MWSGSLGNSIVSVSVCVYTVYIYTVTHTLAVLLSMCCVRGQAAMEGMHGAHIMVQANTATRQAQSSQALLQPHCDTTELCLGLSV